MMRVFMRKTVVTDYPFGKRDITLEANRAYRCTLNPQGAVTGLMDDGRELGLKPGEFTFLPETALEIELAARWMLAVECRFLEHKQRMVEVVRQWREAQK